MSVRKTPSGLDESLTATVKTSTFHSSTNGYYDSKSDKDIQSLFDIYDRFLFPMITEINRCCHVPKFIHFLTLIYIFLQLFFNGYFLFYEVKDDSEIFRIFTKICLCGLGGNYKTMLISQYLLPVINLISFLLLVAIFTSYSIYNEFYFWHKCVIRYWHGGFSIIFIIPHFYSLVSTTSSYITEETSEMYFCFIINIISCIYMIFETLFLTIPLLSSPFLSNVGIVVWRPFNFTMGLLTLAAPLSISAFKNTTDDWSQYISPCLVILISPFSFEYYFKTFPFSGILFNSITLSIPIQLIIMSIFAIVRFSLMKTSEVVFFFIPLIIFGIVNIIMYIYVYKKRKIVIEMLSYNSMNCEEGERTEEKKLEYFRSLTKFRHKKKFFFLQVGLEEACDFFLDWTLSRFLIEQYPFDDDIILFNCWYVSFFPSESNFLHSLVTLSMKIKNRSYLNRVIFHQLHRVHIFRQSSASPEVMTDFSKIRKASQLCVSTVSQFWYGNNTVFNDVDSVFPYLAHHRKVADSMWIEMLDKYPNSAGFANQYSSYLLDAKSKFLEAIFWHQKATALENGSMGQNDKMFSRFVRCFPFYLKRKHVDSFGNLKHGQGKQTMISNAMMRKSTTTSVYNNSSTTGHTNTSSDSLDIDYEEASNFLPMMNLRMAVQKALDNCSIVSVTMISVAALVRLVLSCLYVIIVFVILISVYSKQNYMFENLNIFYKVSECICLISEETAWYYFTAFNEIKLKVPKDLTDTYINLSANLNLTLVNISEMGINYMDQFMRGIYSAEIFNDGLGNLVSADLVDNHICDAEAKPIYLPKSITMDYFIRSYLTLTIKLAKAKERPVWYENDNFCEHYMQTIMMQELMELLAKFVSPNYRNSVENINGTINKILVDKYFDLESSSLDSPESVCAFFIALSPFFLFLFSIPSLMFLSSGIKIERTTMKNVIDSVSIDDRIDASKTILCSNSNEILVVPKQFRNNFFELWFWNFLATIGVILFSVLNAYAVYAIGIEFHEISEHANLFFLQRIYIYDMGRDMGFALFLHIYEKKWGKINFASYNETIERFMVTKAKYTKNLMMLSVGYKNITSANGYDEMITSLRTNSRCVYPISNSSPISFFNCVSIVRLKDALVNTLQEIIASIDTKRLNDDDVQSTHFILLTRLAKSYHDIFEAYQEMYESKVRSINNMSTAILIFSLVVIFVAHITEQVQINKFHEDFETFKELLLRIQPINFVKNTNILSYLLGQNSGKKDNQLGSASQCVFGASNDAMLSLNTNFLIENTNQAATQIFGFTSDQLLGQKLHQLFPNDITQNAQMYSTMQLMISGQSKNIYEFDVSGQKDDSSTVQMRVVLIGFTSNKRNADSFALVCRDLTEEMREKAAILEAKKKSDHILLQLVPKEILARLQKGEEEIAFSVSSATLAFIDIEKFSSYTRSLTSAADIMRIISLIFATFDKIASTFEPITKIKIIGDCYFAGAGLFSSKEKSDSFANVMIQFALQSLEAVDELNLTINANLQLRIGLHTAGPITAGILGSEKPIFDVFGRPVSIAYLLEKSAVSGSIHISNDTYLIVAEEHYSIEPALPMTAFNEEKMSTFSIFPSTDSSRALGYLPKTKSLIVDQQELSKSGAVLHDIVSLSDSFVT